MIAGFFCRILSFLGVGLAGYSFDYCFLQFRPAYQPFWVQVRLIQAVAHRGRETEARGGSMRTRRRLRTGAAHFFERARGLAAVTLVQA